MIYTNTVLPRFRAARIIAALVGALVLGSQLAGCVRGEEPLAAADGGTTTPPPTGTSPPPPGTTPPADSTPPPVDNTPPPNNPPMSDVAAFQATLYPLLRDANNSCVGCHGVAQIPTFAVADVMTAYTVITTQQKVNLVNPELSRVYLRPAVDRHNCGANPGCDRIAADFLAAIRAWAGQQPSTPPPTQLSLMSAVTSFDAAAVGGSGRADGGLVAMFKFDEGTGNMTFDTSGVGTPIALTITGMEWVDGGLKNVSGNAIASAAGSKKLYDMITPTGTYSVEAWIKPDNTAQTGPARIVSYSIDTGTRNFMLGQNATTYRFRNRTAASNANGDPFLEVVSPQVATELTHVVSTFDPATGRKVYVNGALAATETAATTLAWTADQRLVLGNEVTNDRLWQGTFEMVAIHKKALSATEVQQNFAAGAGDYVTMQFDVTSALGATARVDMLARQLDDASYVFARPTFVGPTGTKVKNIRVAVNDVVPVAAQAFRRVDTTVLASGAVLSPLGAVVPLAKGAAMDRFHLEFEALGTHMGLAEAIAPSNPPAAPPDVVDRTVGVRSFSKLNDTMSMLTGVSSTDADIAALYGDVRDSLPSTDDLLAFGSSQQVAIQRLATAYCGEIVAVPATCSSFFGACTIAAGGKTTIANQLYDKLIGTNIANQPDKAATSAGVVSLMDGLGCTNGCTGATATTALQASCAAVLSSGAVTLN
ncbi:MAG: LamG domain-containing protein [Gammaproteobacteria bacterium]